MSRPQPGSAEHGSAPETLVVDNAPAEPQLEKAIPLPVENSSAWKVLPPDSVNVRVEGSADALPEPLPAPEVRITSLPDAADHAPDAAMIPKVNQTAGGNAATAERASNQSAGDIADRSLAAATADASMGVRGAGEDSASRSKSSVQPSSVAEARNDIAHEDESQLNPSQLNKTHDNPIPAEVARIDLAPASRPKSSVLGESSEMPGHIVGTIYLNVGLPKHWILEYWVVGGSLSGVSAPWPYTMFRPEIKFSSGTDSLLIRAHVTVEGCLDNIAAATPGDAARIAGLLDSLKNWKFRPAMKAHQPVAVEILLSIPRQDLP